MENIAASISVVVRVRGESSVLTTTAGLPVIPPIGSELTVECGEDPLPLIVERITCNVTRREIYLFTNLPRVVRQLPDGAAQALTPSEMMRMLIAAGFRITDVWRDDETPPEPHKSKRRRHRARSPPR